MSVSTSKDNPEDSQDSSSSGSKSEEHLTVSSRVLEHTKIRGLLMTQLCLDDLMLDRACRVNLNYSTEVCEALAARQVGNYTEEETSVQKLIALTVTWKSALEYSVPSFFVLILGSYSDRGGIRLLTLVLPQVGTILKISGLIACSFIDSVDANIIAVVAAVPATATGSYPLFNMAYNSYIGATSSKESRTTRFGIANVFSNLGISAGSAIAGALLTKTTLGHSGVLMICVAMEILVVACTFMLISNDATLDPGNNSKHIEMAGDPVKRNCRSICDPRALFAPFKLLFKANLKGRRLKLIMLVISHFLASHPQYGEPVVLYLFTRYRLGWDAGSYGIFSMAKEMSQTAGLVFVGSVLSSWFRISDPLLGVLGSISQITSCCIYALAKTTAMMYIAAGTDIFNIAMIVVGRSIASKLVGTHEQGRLHSIFAVSDTLNPIIANFVYGNLYRATLETLPGAFFILSGTAAIPPFLMFLYFLLGNSKSVI